MRIWYPGINAKSDSLHPLKSAEWRCKDPTMIKKLFPDGRSLGDINVSAILKQHLLIIVL